MTIINLNTNPLGKHIRNLKWQKEAHAAHNRVVEEVRTRNLIAIASKYAAKLEEEA